MSSLVESGTTITVEARCVDNPGRVFDGVSVAHQTCLALELVLVQTLQEIRPMATMQPRSPSTVLDGDADPQAMVIASLRSQVGDLLTQVSQLNGKLVQSYDRISDLEDNLHFTSNAQRAATLKISGLELERTQHLAALNTGLLVEKAHVTSELTRLMEKATEEASKRGLAESARHEIEKDLDDLSAELFGRANGMVAEARLAQAKSERRVQDAEAGLRSAEEAVRAMQDQMQGLRDDKERADRVLDKGKWVERPTVSVDRPMRLLSTHSPYTEFLLFVAHLRQLRLSSPQPPPIATLLPLPFIVRLIAEDSDPTLRLDAAPALNWLTRRTVTTAIHSSQLIVEPLSIAALSVQYADPHSATCALCGKTILSSMSMSSPPPTQNSSVASWRPSFLKNTTSTQSSPPPASQNRTSPHIHSPTPSIATTGSFYPPSTSTPPPTPPLNTTALPSVSEKFVSEPQAIYAFRLQAQSSGAQHSSTPTQQTFPHPHSSSVTMVQSHTRTSSQTSQSPNSFFYPLCSTGWCLARLRTTCELWRFVRVGIVGSVWEEEAPQLPSAVVKGAANGHVNTTPNGKPPPIPPRRRGLGIGMGKLFGIASSALSKGASSPSKESVPPPPSKETATGAVLTPPPLPRRNETREKRREARESRERAMSIAQHHPPTSPKSSPIPSKRILTDPAEIPLPDSPIFDHDEEHEMVEKEDAKVANDPTATKEESETQADVIDKKQEEMMVNEKDGGSFAMTTTANGTTIPSRTASPAINETEVSSSAPPIPRRAPRRAAPVPPVTSNTAETTEGSSPVGTNASNSEVPKTLNGSSGVDEHSKEITTENTKEVGKQPTSVNETSTTAAAVTSPDNPPRRARLSISEKRTDDDRASSIRSSKTAQSDTSGQFVGDATWEERTWRNLARFKEDMFYAKIGCAR